MPVVGVVAVVLGIWVDALPLAGVVVVVVVPGVVVVPQLPVESVVLVLPDALGAVEGDVGAVVPEPSVTLAVQALVVVLVMAGRLQLALLVVAGVDPVGLVPPVAVAVVFTQFVGSLVTTVCAGRAATTG